MTEVNRTCPLCGKKKNIDLFPPMGDTTKFSQEGKSPYCASCLGERIDRHDLETIDTLCRFLDLPFDADAWVRMQDSKDTLEEVILDYSFELVHGRYANSDWFLVNKMWEKTREYNRVMEDMESISGDLLLYLRKKWGHIDSFDLEDYMRMEEYERNTLSRRNYVEEAKKDTVRKLAKLSVLADKMISAGDTKNATAYLQSYNTFLKESGIRSETLSDEGTITSLSELVAYLERTGFLLDYRISEDRDVVDKTITNMQQYTKRLFSDSSETVGEMYEAKKIERESGTDIKDEDLDVLYASNGEEAIELEETMDETELEQMFQSMENDKV